MGEWLEEELKFCKELKQIEKFHLMWSQSDS